MEEGINALRRRQLIEMLQTSGEKEKVHYDTLLTERLNFRNYESLSPIKSDEQEGKHTNREVLVLSSIGSIGVVGWSSR